MKFATRLIALLLLAPVLWVLPGNASARFNPSVQPSFFQSLDTNVSSNAPPAVMSGNVIEAGWQRLSWEVRNVKRTHVPLVIEFYSSDPQLCAQYNPLGSGECSVQPAEFDAAALAYGSKARFIRVDVSQFPAVLNGPDVRVLPTHIFIADYSDATHYTAIKVWGLLTADQIEQVIADTFNVTP